ncbi:hypothetical protein DRO26_04995 [Candidatus Bathyarchaeota archaeon]|nr:MAG: hypothetical protein DRO26_04995 [Candidatus Bathyarchaeota archaeon]
MKEVTLTIPDDLYKYLTFLEKRCLIKDKGQALTTALEFYKMFSMHEWFPYSYKMGGGRVVLMEVGAIKDLCHALTDEEVYTAAKMTAFKRKLVNPLLQGVDLTNLRNWDIVLREMEVMGWGKFTRVHNEVRVEFCPIPTPYLRGYLDTMFNVEFEEHKTKVPEMLVLIAKRRRRVKLEEV